MDLPPLMPFPGAPTDTDPIDRDLIVGGDDGGDTLEISGGCICCSYGSDLMEALRKARARLSMS